MMKRIYLSILVLISVILLIGCSANTQKKKFANIYEETGSKNAINYIEQKYGFTPKVEDVICDTDQYIKGSTYTSPGLTGDVYVKMKYNKKYFYVFINGSRNTNEGYDNYQIEEIREAFVKQLEKIIGCDICYMEFAYGLSETTRKEAKEYGLVNDYFNGENLNEILENSKNNSVGINYISGKDCNVNLEDIIENFGKNADYVFINYIDENSYNLIDEYKFDVYNDFDGKKLLFTKSVRDYIIICEEQKIYAKCNENKF